MSQDSDGIAEVMRGGVQLGVTLAGQAVETAARMRERSRLAAAADATRVAEDAQRRLAADRAVALVAAGDRLERAERAVADGYDSRMRREGLQARLVASAGEEAAAARALADTAQARPATAIASMTPPAPKAAARAVAPSPPSRMPQAPER